MENIADDLQQQQEDIADLDVKVDATIGTVVTIGGKVVEHEKEIGELGEGLVKVEERVDDVEEDLGDTKIKVEEIDNKVSIYNYGRIVPNLVIISRISNENIFCIQKCFVLLGVIFLCYFLVYENSLHNKCIGIWLK